MKFRYVTLDEAIGMVPHWRGDPASVVHIENFSSSVFKFNTIDGDARILRFIDHQQRTLEQVQGELEFLEHLKTLNIHSCYPVQSQSGSLTLTFEALSGLQTCSVFNFVPGLELNDSSPNWGIQLFQKWGRNLASIHAASRTFRPQTVKRWTWDEEHLIAHADMLIPKEDTKSRELLREIIGECRSLEKTNSNFGLIHGDHAPNNFIFNPESKEITAIDFGNCCYHWYLADLGIAFSVIRRKENNEAIKAGILEGYSETEVLPKDCEYLFDLFIRLRVIYVYLDRLHRFGPNPTATEAESIRNLKERVHLGNGW